MCEINLEAELFTLQDSNAKLVAALQEANSSVEQWKKQLAEYQEETDRLRDQVTYTASDHSKRERSNRDDLWLWLATSCLLSNAHVQLAPKI